MKRYSSGMFARLGVSVAAHVEPDPLIVDEVLSVGDDVFPQECLERMNDTMTGGVTVIFVSHMRLGPRGSSSVQFQSSEFLEITVKTTPECRTST